MAYKKTTKNFLSLRPSRNTGWDPREYKIFGSFFLVIIFLLAGFFIISSSPKNLKQEDIKYVKIAGQSVKAELALDDTTKMKGLSGRSGLANNVGMLFIFTEPGNYPFWMKDMNFPIDIIWIGEDMSVIYIKKDARPESYPETFGPEQDAKYILEVQSGFSGKNNLKIGDIVQFF